MISLSGLVNQKAFGKFEMGKVISNPFATAFAPQIKEGEDSDYEVSMAAKQLDDIIKSATELKAKMGENEFNVAAWIQDHISKSQDYINQANYGFDKNESVVNEDNTPFETLMLIRNLEQTNKLLAQDLKTSKRLPNDKKENIKKSIVVNQSLINYYKEILKQQKSVNEGRCLQCEIQEAMSAKTPKIFVKTAAVEKKIRELMADRKKAVVPYNKETDPKKKEILKQILIKLTQQIQAYEKNLIQLRDMEEEYIQQMNADAELDASAFD